MLSMVYDEKKLTTLDVARRKPTYQSGAIRLTVPKKGFIDAVRQMGLTLREALESEWLIRLSYNRDEKQIVIVLERVGV